MSAKIKAITVVLEHDVRSDDIAPIVDAIKMIKGVADVTEQEVTSEDMLARMRVRSDLRLKLHEAVESVMDPKNG